MERTYRFRVNESQFRDAIKHSSRRIVGRSGMRPLLYVLNMLFLLACAGVAFSVGAQDESTDSYLLLSMGVLFVLIGALQAATHFSVMRGLTRGNDVLFEEQSLVISEAGVRVERSDVQATFGWTAIKSIEAIKSQILIYIDTGSALSVPDSAFPNLEERWEFIREIEARCGIEMRVPITSSDVEAPNAHPASQATAAKTFWSDLRANLVAGLRMAVFLPIKVPTPQASWTQFVALTGLQLAIIMIFDVIQVGSHGQLNSYSLPGTLFGTTLAFAAAWSLALLSGRSERTLLALVAISALAVPFEVLTQLLAMSSERQLFRSRLVMIFSIPDWWFALAAGVAAIRVLGIAPTRRLMAILLAAAILALPSSTLYRDRSIWTKAYDKDEQAKFEKRYNALTQEDVFYLQPKLLERELAGLKAGRKGIIDLYFIGGAGWAGQDVFMKEIQSVSTLFEERFDAKGRTIRLVNNAKTVGELPIASATSIGQAVKRVAEVMDRDEDILFLFLTSHGSKDHRFSLEFYPMKFNELTPDLLKNILDESGIRRRVLVISACYSGGFVDALKNENTLVITAAAPDKNSFGCSNEADFTYFGKAYFDEALRETFSFVNAFEIARPRIAEREKKSNYNPSDPRIFVGEAIRAPLAELERDLQASRSPAAGAAAGLRPVERPRINADFVHDQQKAAK